MDNFKTFHEKTVIGLIETMTIHGVGDVDVKIDSGNGAYNVLTAHDIQIQGNKVSFRTVDEKHVVKDVIDTVVINVGAGNIEERPVVNFRITFGGKDYDNIPFSLGDRSSNEYKILVGKEFLKELDTLIDINSNYIADKNIDVS
jgi:hypothetical protein